MSCEVAGSKRRLWTLSQLVAAALFASSTAVAAPRELCEASSDLQRDLEHASSPASEPINFDDFIAPFRALRERLPEELFVHMRYQDAVNERGIEGHLKQMVEEYSALRDAHPGSILYRYLFARALEGRSTRQSIMILEEVLASNPDFAPAHRTLAEIYDSAAFRDRQKDKTERAAFERLCPGSAIARRPTPPPDQSPLWAQVEELLRRARSDERVPDLVSQALQQDEWRLQRIRPYDWYTPDEKRRATEVMQLEYWKGWRMLVQHFWKTNQTEKAEQQISDMQERLGRLWRREPASDLSWSAGTTLLSLYSQAKQRQKIRETLAMMQSSLKAKPDAKRAAQLARLKARLLSRG